MDFRLGVISSQKSGPAGVRTGLGVTVAFPLPVHPLKGLVLQFTLKKVYALNLQLALFLFQLL